MTLLVHDDVFLEHDTGSHIENRTRLRAIHAELLRRGLIERCTRLPVAGISEDDILRIHSQPLLDLARQTSDEGGGRLDPDTVVSERSFQVAKLAAGSCVSAVDHVLRGPEKRALVLTRPPGHHATPTYSMGFCIFNNVALAADHARRVHGLDRVLIVDWDIHHGNGTQDIFYADGGVHFVSAHRYGGGFYPGTGAANETGTGAGLGATTNVPFRAATAPLDYREAFRAAVEAAADRCKPQLIILSAGFDAHRADPLGEFTLETEDFVELTKIMIDVAKAHCGGKLVSCLEGGYNLDALAQSVAGHLETLLDVDAPSPTPL